MSFSVDSSFTRLLSPHLSDDVHTVFGDIPDEMTEQQMAHLMSEYISVSEKHPIGNIVCTDTRGMLGYFKILDFVVSKHSYAVDINMTYPDNSILDRLMGMKYALVPNVSWSNGRITPDGNGLFKLDRSRRYPEQINYFILRFEI